MAQDESRDMILAFDTIYSTKEIQLLKLASAYIDPQAQPLLAAFIRLKELSYCYEMIDRFQFDRLRFETDKLDRFLELARPYCNERQAALFGQIRQVRRYMNLFEKLRPIMETMPNADSSSFFDDFSNFDLSQFQQGDGSMNTTDLSGAFSGLFSKSMNEHQQSLYESYKKQFEKYERSFGDDGMDAGSET